MLSDNSSNSHRPAAIVRVTAVESERFSSKRSVSSAVVENVYGNTDFVELSENDEKVSRSHAAVRAKVPRLLL